MALRLCLNMYLQNLLVNHHVLLRNCHLGVISVISNFQTQPHAVFNQQVQSFKMLTYPKLPISVDPYPLGTVAFAPLPDFWVPPTRNSWSPTVRRNQVSHSFSEKRLKIPVPQRWFLMDADHIQCLMVEFQKVDALHSNLSCLNRLSLRKIH